ncbi:unnamed protein product [Polarella glacialis]|uniref:Uncharacterized protein n=1 Tax=Polarella glacialis TaxID=89957 RepID=A0A813HD43_POLGL|nr:unnamed protein product [Polarella glacialis]
MAREESNSFATRLRSEVLRSESLGSGTQDSRTSMSGTGAELEEAIAAAAAKQASLAARWYGVSDGNAADPPGDMKEAVVAASAWMNALPAGTRSLLVLVDGADYLVDPGARQFLTHLLRAHAGLHLLVTVDEKRATGLAPLSMQISEPARVVPLPPLSDLECAEVLVSVLLSRQMGSLLAGIPRAEIIPRLAQNTLIRGCQGRLEDVMRAAESVGSGDSKLLEDLQELPAGLTPAKSRKFSTSFSSSRQRHRRREGVTTPRCSPETRHYQVDSNITHDPATAIALPGSQVK